MVKRSFPGSPHFKETRKHFKSNLLLVVVLVLESKGLQYVVKSNEPEIKPAENIYILSGELSYFLVCTHHS